MCSTPAAAVLGIVGVFRDAVKWPAAMVAALAGGLTTLALVSWVVPLFLK